MGVTAKKRWPLSVALLVFSQHTVPCFTQQLRGVELIGAMGDSDNRADAVQAEITGPSHAGHSSHDLATIRSQQTESRALSMKDMDFHPLSCNEDVDSVDCSSWSDQNFETYDHTVVIPCGVCVTMDYDGDSLYLTHGLDIQGKLIFPDGYRVTIFTPFVFVQGKLVISSTAPISPEHQSVSIVLTGTNEALTSFVPHAENAMACMGGSCSVGKKPFVVAGGEVEISGLFENCPSWVNLHDVITGGPALPGSIPAATRALDGCPRIIIDEAFDDEGSAGWRGIRGAEYTTTSDNSTSDSNPFLVVSDRTRDWQGPYFDIVKQKDCLIPDTTYLFHARLRLTKSAGGASDCSTSGENCPSLVSRCRTEEDQEDYSRTLGRMHQATAVPDGEWFTFAAEVKFTADETDPDSVFELLVIEGPEPGVEIAIDDAMLALPPEELYPDRRTAEEICVELMPHLSLGMHNVPYPFYSTRDTATLVLTTDSNVEGQVYTLKGRQDNWASMSSTITPDCIVKHAVYRFSGLFRLHSSRTIDDAYIELRSTRDDGSAFSSRLTNCPNMGGEAGWVRCESEIVFTKDLEEAAEHEWRLVTGSDTQSDVDYSDVHFTFVHGPVNGLVLDSSIYPWWGAGSEILITSHTIDYDDDQVRRIADVQVQENGDHVTLMLDSSVLPPTTTVQDKHFAVEVALLSRNIMFEALQDDDNGRHGAHFIFLHTPGVQQKLQGVELRGFGQQGNLGRYPIHFHMCGSVLGSIVSKNVIRNSNQRCVVIHGSHNVSVQDNVAYDTAGHCYMTEDGGEIDNTFYRNLGASTRKVVDLISEDESDDQPSTFWITNPQNVFDGNVAAGSEVNGYWLELRNAVRGPSAKLEMSRDMNPKSLSLRRFSNNVAHSCGSHGLRTYPSGFKPPESAVFYNMRSYKNVGDGVFFHNSRNLSVVEGVFADNRIQIDIDRSRSVNVSAAVIVGRSALYQSVTESQKLFRVRSHCPDEKPLVGIQLHTFRNAQQEYWTGAHLTDVVFDGFNDTGCAQSVAMNFDDEIRIGHFDFHSSFSNLTFLNGTIPLDMCTVNVDGVEDVHVTDIDGSLDVTGTSPGANSIVSNKKWMTEFLGDKCSPVSDMCYAYCRDVCLRTVTYAVDAFGTEDVTLHVYDFPDHSRMFDVRGNWWHSTKMLEGSNVRVTDVYESTFYRDYRYFSATLPAGSYAAEFRHKNGTEMWPTFAMASYEEAPPCDGSLEKDAVKLMVPDANQNECDDLVKNGDAELGNYSYWYHTGGGVGVEQFAGVKGSWALVSTRRDSEYHGLATYLDSRCTSRMKGVEFEVEAKVRLEDAGFAHKCDPGASTYNDACPQVSLMMHGSDTSPSKGIKRTEGHGVANALVSMDSDGWYTLHGVFTISEEMSHQDSIMLYVSRTFKKAKLLLDNVSVRAMPDRCTEKADGDMVLNGDMELSDNRFWHTHGTASLSILPSGGVDGTHALLVSDRGSRYTGPRQQLTSTCFEAGKQYEIKASFKLFRGEVPLVCDTRSSDSDELRCPEGRLVGKQGRRSKYQFVAATIDAGDGADRWGTIHGIFTASEDSAAADELHLYFDRAAEDVDVLIDDVSLKPYDMDCSDLIRNGGAEAGDTRHWQTYGRGTIAVRGEGANGSGHALIARGRGNAGWGIGQRLATQCVNAGDIYYFGAKVKLANATDGADYHCDPTTSSGPMSCPVATLKAEGNGYMSRNIAKVTRRIDVEGWYDMRGVFEMFESDAAAPIVMLYFRDAPKGVDIIVDDVQARRTSLP